MDVAKFRIYLSSAVVFFFFFFWKEVYMWNMWIWKTEYQTTYILMMMSRLIWIYAVWKSLLLLPMAIKDLKLIWLAVILSDYLIKYCNTRIQIRQSKKKKKNGLRIIYFPYHAHFYLFIYLFTFSFNFKMLSQITSPVKYELQLTLVISKSKGLCETLRDIRTSTYQICGTEKNN